MSPDDLRRLPAATDLPTLARAMAISEPVAREWHRRGEFERMGIRILRLGAQWRVVTADILRVLNVPPAGRDLTRPAGPDLPAAAHQGNLSTREPTSHGEH